MTRWPSSDSVTPATVHVFPSRKSGLEFTALQGSRRLGRLICPSPRFVGIDSIPQTVDLFLVRGVCAAGTQLVRPPDEEQEKFKPHQTLVSKSKKSPADWKFRGPSSGRLTAA